MAVPHFEILDNNKIRLCNFDKLDEKFILHISNYKFLFLQPYKNDKRLDENHILIQRTGDIVEDPVFYNMVRITNSDKYNYMYVSHTNSYIPIP